MADLICKYCGKKLKSMGSVLRSDISNICQVSPSKKHIALPNPPYCVYCGEETKKANFPSISDLICFSIAE
jgi:hypothetical protein